METNSGFPKVETAENPKNKEESKDFYTTINLWENIDQEKDDEDKSNGFADFIKSTNGDMKRIMGCGG